MNHLAAVILGVLHGVFYLMSGEDSLLVVCSIYIASSLIIGAIEQEKNK